MKHIITFCAAILMTASLFAQSPDKISYQAVIRNSSNDLIKSTTVGMQISILQGTADGKTVFVETQTPATNTNGLVSLEIGSGKVVSGTFSSIDWSKGPYFIKTETDPAGGKNYSITGTSQLLSVPYALHAKTAEMVSGKITETDPRVPSGTATGQMQYWNGTAWVTVAAGNEGQVLTFSNGVPKWKTPLVNEDVESPTTGKIWMDRNLGASQVATSSNDEAAYGDLYQWGRGTDGHQIRTSATTTNLSSSDIPGHGDFILISFDWRSPQNNNLWQGVNGVNNPCPSGYRLPTDAEWEAELTTWGANNNAAGAFASPLKLPMAGYRFGLVYNAGTQARYWSSTVSGTNSRNLSVSTSANLAADNRAYGFSVRCIKN